MWQQKCILLVMLRFDGMHQFSVMLVPEAHKHPKVLLVVQTLDYRRTIAKLPIYSNTAVTLIGQSHVYI